MDDARRRSNGVACKVLLIGSDDGRLTPVVDPLRSEFDVQIESDPRRALAVCREFRPDLVLIDADYDGVQPLSVVVQLNAETEDDGFLSFVVFSRSGRPAINDSSFKETLPVLVFDGSDATQLSRVVHHLGASRRATLRVIAKMRFAQWRQQEMEELMIRQLTRLAECRDHPDSGHVERVGELSAGIAMVMGLESDEVTQIRLASRLHDVGKLRISSAILDKDDLLSLEEMDVVKTHTALGAALLAGTTNPVLHMGEIIALNHHENWDGTGYSPGVGGTAIPLPGRIVRVADTFDAITMPRPFAEAYSGDAAVGFLRENAGRLFDPAVVEAFMEVYERGEVLRGERASSSADWS